MPSTSITWIAKMDERTCPICRTINGFTWNFPIEEGVPDQLVHGQYGVVWDKHIGSQAHGHQVYNCRCSILPQIHAEDLQKKVQLLMSAIEQQMVYVEFIRYGKPVGAFRDVQTGRFVRPSR